MNVNVWILVMRLSSLLNDELKLPEPPTNWEIATAFSLILLSTAMVGLFTFSSSVESDFL